MRTTYRTLIAEYDDSPVPSLVYTDISYVPRGGAKSPGSGRPWQTCAAEGGCPGGRSDGCLLVVAASRRGRFETKWLTQPQTSPLSPVCTPRGLIAACV